MKNGFIAFCIVVALGLAGCAKPYSPGPVSKSLLLESTGTIWYESNDGYDLVAYSSAPSITVEGDLSIPKIHNGGAVILSHGSGGKGVLHDAWRNFLKDNGFAVFLLDHFRPRNVINVLHSQVRVTEQQMGYDILNAFALLRSHPLIDENRIFHMGWSKGATSGLLASSEKVQEMVLPSDTSAKFAGFIGFYPWCGIRGKIRSSSPVLILHGDADDYTPLSFCESLVDDMTEAGTNVRIERFSGAVHGFDKWGVDQRRHDYITIRTASDDCTLVMDPLTLSVQSKSGRFTVGTFDDRKSYLSHCAEQGVMYGGSPQYRSRTEKVILEFLADNGR